MMAKTQGTIPKSTASRRAQAPVDEAQKKAKSKAIWISQPAHRAVSAAVALMRVTDDEKYEGISLGLWAETALMKALRDFYSEHGQTLGNGFREVVKEAKQKPKR